MNRTARRQEASKTFAYRQSLQPDVLTRVPPDQWPTSQGPVKPIEVWLSKTFLVVVWLEESGERMSVNRTSRGKGGWEANITWDELQDCKRAIGRGEQWAVECFPPDRKLVNVANMRHLWLLDNDPQFGWH